MAGYQEVAEQMQKEILNGKYVGRMPTMAELAKSYSVSKMTMQRAIAVLKENDAVITSPKRGICVTRLKRPRTHVLGALLRGEGDAPLHDQLIYGMQKSASEHGEMIAVVRRSLATSEAEVDQISQMIEKQKVDGIIIWPLAYESDSNVIQYMIDKNIPFVVVPDADPQEYANCNIVSNSDQNASNDIMMHLIGTGHRNIAYVASKWSENSSFITHRYKQYQKCMKLSGLEPAEVLYVEDIVESADVLKNYTAVFCATDQIAILLCRKCLEEGIRVPKDLCVVGYDNTKVAVDLQLTSVEQHFEKIGRLAIELLLNDIELEPEVKEHRKVESELIIRKSTQKVNE